MKSKLWVKILIPILIIAVIGGIWIVKNSTEKPADDSGGSQNNTELSDNLKDADFGLRETKAIDFEALSAYGLPIIIDYGADSCIPCKQMAPVLEKANKEFYGKAFVKFINVWDYPDAANNVPVQVIPTQVLFNADGTPFVPSEELEKKIQFDMYSHRDTGEHIFTVHQGGLTEEQMWEILKEMGVE
ncbi:MAG: thioredoxin family protein [Ruminococcus sp.]|jgi:thioredoxin 1|nr:thioredoxin family protein [Ruminococcus sp.]